MKRRGGLCVNFFHSYQAIILILCSIFCLGNFFNINHSILDVIFHYLILVEQWLVASFILLESLKFICFFLVCQYYCKQALAFLENRKQWMSMLKFLMLIGISISIIGAVVLITDGLMTDVPSLLCQRPLFLILRAGGQIIVFFFLSVGIMLTMKLRNL